VFGEAWELGDIASDYWEGIVREGLLDMIERLIALHTLRCAVVVVQDCGNAVEQGMV
jgi:hypothetical protein